MWNCSEIPRNYSPLVSCSCTRGSHGILPRVHFRNAVYLTSFWRRRWQSRDLSKSGGLISLASPLITPETRLQDTCSLGQPLPPSTWTPSWANVRSKTGLKKGQKPLSWAKKSRKTSKSEIENWPKRGQKWTSKTALKSNTKIHQT
jgi:hypothetical protein